MKLGVLVSDFRNMDDTLSRLKADKLVLSLSAMGYTMQPQRRVARNPRFWKSLPTSMCSLKTCSLGDFPRQKLTPE